MVDGVTRVRRSWAGRMEPEMRQAGWWGDEMGGRKVEVWREAISAVLRG